MLKKKVWVSLSFCLLSLGVVASAQTGKAGLWEVKATTKFQKPGSGPGMFNQTESTTPANSDGPGQPACYTQEQIDNYGILLPPSLRDCKTSNTVRTANSLAADLTCTGWSSGKGSVETTWLDNGHATAVMHFVVKKQHGQETLSMTWTQEATAVFKSSDCGNVLPRKAPQPAK